jgi:hypothetical protein
MSAFRFFVLLPLFLLAYTQGICQQEIDEYAQAIIKQLRSGNNDTVVTYTSFNGGGAINTDTIPGIGTTTVFSNLYILYRKAGKTYTVKCTIYNGYNRNEITESLLTHSIPLEIRNDTIFNWIKNSIPALKYQRLLPFIYRKNDYTDSLPAFDIDGRIHDTYYSITIYTGDHNFRLSAQQIETQRTLFENSPLDTVIHRINVNYKYNSSTKFFALLAKFKALVLEYDSYFRFTK